MVKETGKKKVATTVETGTLLDLALEDLAGEVVRGKVGDVNVAYLARELDAALGVEQVGVDIFPELSHYPDSIFATLTLLGYLNHPSQIREFFQSLPAISFKKTKVPCANELKKTVMAKLSERIHLLEPTEINTVDGLRLESADSWMLIRASGTEPAIRVMVESTSKAQVDKFMRKGVELVQNLVEEGR